MDESERRLRDRERLLLAIESSGPRAIRDHIALARRVHRQDQDGWGQVKQALADQGTSLKWRDRAWWKKEAVILGTDWSSLLRQRIRVLAWVRAGRPPISQWVREQRDAERAAAEQAIVDELDDDGEPGGELRRDGLKVS